MVKDSLFSILGGLFLLFAVVQAQSVDTAVEELERRGLLTRTIEKYRKDSGQYAYIKDLILVAYDLVRKGIITSEISTKIDRLESEVAKLRSSKTSTITTMDEERIKDLVRTKVSELLKLYQDETDKFETLLKADSLRIAQLEKEVQKFEQRSSGIVAESPRWGILWAVVFASTIALLSAH